MGKTLRIALGLIAVIAILSGCGSPGPNAVGTAPPEFSVVYLNDTAQTQSLAKLKGKVVLIDFWATWCGPCNMELPKIQGIYSRNKDKGLEVLAISDEQPQTLFDFQKSHNMQVPIFIDQGKEASAKLSIEGLPTTIVVGKDGKIIYSEVGYEPGDEEKLEATIVKELGS